MICLQKKCALLYDKNNFKCSYYSSCWLSKFSYVVPSKIKRMPFILISSLTRNVYFIRVSNSKTDNNVTAWVVDSKNTDFVLWSPEFRRVLLSFINCSILNTQTIQGNFLIFLEINILSYIEVVVKHWFNKETCC